MSEHPFDSLARTLADGASRRGVLKAIGGAVLGSLVAAPAQTVLAAGNSTCAHFCAAVFGADTPAANQCTSDAAHGKGLCVTCGANTSPSSVCCTRNGSGLCASYGAATCCTSGQACCNGTCLNPNTYATDANNCGSCGHKCPAGASCVAGLCQQQVGGACDATTSCFASTGGVHLGACCNGTCSDTANDNNSCGTCGHVCAAGETCQNGACTCGAHGDCPAGQSCCNGMCVNEQIDTQNCGACGHACGSGQVCQNGTCVTPCTGGGGSCSGNGGCCSGTCCQGTCCGPSQVCLSNGTCVTTCTTSSTCACKACASDISAPNFPTDPGYCFNGSTAGTACGSDSDCSRGYYCGYFHVCLGTC